MGPFKYLAGTFILQSANKMYMATLNSSTGLLQIFPAADSSQIIWTTTFNSAVTLTENSLFSLVLTCTGNLSIINQCDQTIWSSQTAYPLKFNSLSLLLTNSGQLVIVSNQEQIWSSTGGSSRTLSVYSPLESTSDFVLISADQQTKLQLINGDLYLQTLNISQTGGTAKEAQITAEGNFRLTNANGQIVYEISSDFSSNTCPFGATYIVSNNQFLGYLNRNTICDQSSILFVRPYFVPSGIPSAINGAQPLQYFPSSQIENFYFILFYVDNALVIDFVHGTLGIMNVQSGNYLGLKRTFFLSPVAMNFYLQPNGLLVLQTLNTANQKNISLWNSGTAQPKDSTIKRTEILEEGKWILFCNSNVSLVLNPGNTYGWSITSVTTITRSAEQNDLSQSQNFFNAKWKIISPQNRYFFTFLGNGKLAVFVSETIQLYWESTEEGNKLIFDENGNLNLLTENNVQIPILVPPPSLNMNDYPYSLCLTDIPSLVIINTVGDIQATLTF